MQIARDEISSEIRVMQELLPAVMSKHLGLNCNRQPSFKFLQESARTLLSNSWDHFLRHQKKSTEVTPRVKPEPPPLNLSGVQLSPSTESLLAHGPKYAPAVANTKVDQLAAVYEIAAKIPEDSRQDFVAAGSRAVCFHGETRKNKNAATPAIKELQSAELRVLQADKTGGFVILNKEQMQEKTDETLKKNFLPLKSRPSGSLRSQGRHMATFPAKALQVQQFCMLLDNTENGSQLFPLLLSHWNRAELNITAYEKQEAHVQGTNIALVTNFRQESQHLTKGAAVGYVEEIQDSAAIAVISEDASPTHHKGTTPSKLDIDPSLPGPQRRQLTDVLAEFNFQPPFRDVYRRPNVLLFFLSLLCTDSETQCY
ncbi:uncharacterized protein ISCGN_031841 [Ixodes scapularis]